MVPYAVILFHARAEPTIAKRGRQRGRKKEMTRERGGEGKGRKRKRENNV